MNEDVVVLAKNAALSCYFCLDKRERQKRIRREGVWQRDITKGIRWIPYTTSTKFLEDLPVSPKS